MADLRFPHFSRQYTAPRADASSSLSETYDYSGLDDLTQKQGALRSLRDAKFEANFKGDPSAVTAGNKIRDLLQSVREHLPGATERDPGPSLSPLVRVASRSTSNSTDTGGGGIAEEHGGGEQRMGGNVAIPPMAPPPGRRPPANRPPAARRPAGPKPPPLTDVGLYPQTAVENRLREIANEVDIDVDVSDAPTVPDGIERRLRFPMA
jgi:hypothetical protein